MTQWKARMGERVVQVTIEPQGFIEAMDAVQGTQGFIEAVDAVKERVQDGMTEESSNEEAKSIRDAMIEKGASDMQLNSKTFAMLEDILTERAEGMRELEIATAREQVRKLAEQAKMAKEQASWARSQLENLSQGIVEYKLAVQEATNATYAIGENATISDRAVIDGVLAYREILKATVEILSGADLPESVMCKAVEEAGYSYWRSIMGPKHATKKDQKDPYDGAVVL